MTPNFKLAAGSYSVSKFHSGELQVTIIKSTSVQNTITGSVLSSDHIMELLQLVEALKYTYPRVALDLIMPYCAFSRQDRRCNTGESFSLKIFTDLINSCNFSSVTTWDNHSDVATALINNCDNKSVSALFEASLWNDNMELDLDQYHYFVSPDAGANKKVLDCSKKFNMPMIRADKSRDPATMAITGTEVYATAEQLDGATVLIIDDILAGGRTMIELAKSLKTIQPNVTIHIFITHMFANYGFQLMIDAGTSKFITTDSVIYSVYADDVVCSVDIIRL